MTLAAILFVVTLTGTYVKYLIKEINFKVRFQRKFITSMIYFIVTAVA